MFPFRMTASCRRKRKAGRTSPGAPFRGGPKSPTQSGHYRHDADNEEGNDPACSGVCPHTERMGQGHRPADVGEPMETPPGSWPEAESQKAGHEDGQHEVEADGTYADPETAER
jgi:hypothetical protein